jgi:hypothetical protein
MHGGSPSANLLRDWKWEMKNLLTGTLIHHRRRSKNTNFFTMIWAFLKDD